MASYNGGISLSGDKKRAKEAIEQALALANTVRFQKEQAGLAKHEKVYDIDGGGTVRVVDMEHVRHLHIYMPELPAPEEEEEPIEEVLDRDVWSIRPPYSDPPNNMQPKATWTNPPAPSTDLAAVAIAGEPPNQAVYGVDGQFLKDVYSFETGTFADPYNMGRQEWVGETGIRLYCQTTEPKSSHNLKLGDEPEEHSPAYQRGRNIGLLWITTPDRTNIGLGIFNGHMVYIGAEAWNTTAYIRARPVAVSTDGIVTNNGDYYEVGTFEQTAADYGLGSGSPTSAIGSDWFCFSPDGSKAVRNRAFGQGSGLIVQQDVNTETPYSSGGGFGTDDVIEYEAYTNSWFKSFKEELVFTFNTVAGEVELASRTKTANTAGPVTKKYNRRSYEHHSFTPDEWQVVINETDSPPNRTESWDDVVTETYSITGGVSEVVAYDYDWDNNLVTVTLLIDAAVSSDVYTWTQSNVDTQTRSASVPWFYGNHVSATSTSDAGSWSRPISFDARSRLSISRAGTTYIIPYSSAVLPSSSENNTSFVSGSTSYTGGPDEFDDGWYFISRTTGFTTSFSGSWASNLRGSNRYVEAQMGITGMDLRAGLIVVSWLDQADSIDGTASVTSSQIGDTSAYDPDPVPTVVTTTNTGGWDHNVTRNDILYRFHDPTLGLETIPIPNATGVTDVTGARPLYQKNFDATRDSYQSPTFWGQSPAGYAVYHVTGVNPGVVNYPGGQMSGSFTSSIGGTLAMDPKTMKMMFSVRSIDLMTDAAEDRLITVAVPCDQALHYYDPDIGFIDLQAELWPAHDLKDPTGGTALKHYGFASQVEWVTKDFSTIIGVAQ